MITYYEVENFKQLQHVQTEFSNLNVIIGPNSVGKSSLLQSIDFLKAFVSSSVDYYLEKKGIVFTELFNKQFNDKVISRKKISWVLKVKLSDQLYQYEVSITSTKHLIEKFSHITEQGVLEELYSRKGQKYVIKNNHNDTEGNFLNPSAGFLASITKENSNEYPSLYLFKNFIENIKTFLIWDPNVLRTRSRGNKEELGEHGQNLATVLGDLKKQNPRQFQRLIRRVQRIIPTLEDISVKRSVNGWKEIILHERVGKGNLQFSRHQMSDGTLRLLAIACLRYGINMHSVISFEEPENGVHPPVLREAVQMIEEITQLRDPKKSQVFMTTHNPYLLDLFKDRTDSIFIMEKSELDGAKIHHLPEDTIEYAKLLFNDSIGELWYSNQLFTENGEGE